MTVCCLCAIVKSKPHSGIIQSHGPSVAGSNHCYVGQQQRGGGSSCTPPSPEGQLRPSALPTCPLQGSMPSLPSSHRSWASLGPGEQGSVTTGQEKTRLSAQERDSYPKLRLENLSGAWWEQASQPTEARPRGASQKRRPYTFTPTTRGRGERLKAASSMTLGTLWEATSMRGTEY